MQCSECGAVACEQKMQGGAGCIAYATLGHPRSNFFCHLCTAKVGKSLPYGFQGYGGRTIAKMTWPFLLLTIQLESLRDPYLAGSLKSLLQYEYSACPENVSFPPRSFGLPHSAQMASEALHMKKGAETYETKKLGQHIDFIKEAIAAHKPPNMIVVMDTHSDSLTGYLQHQGGSTGAQSTSVGQIVDLYVTSPLLVAMQGASGIARSTSGDAKTPNGKSPWAGMTAKSRGGWRGLIMVTCGPAIRSPVHFESVRSLVKS